MLPPVIGSPSRYSNLPTIEAMADALQCLPLGVVNSLCQGGADLAQ
jgi:hypothetical protein